jgi:hypothetical protein
MSETQMGLDDVGKMLPEHGEAARDFLHFHEAARR